MIGQGFESKDMPMMREAGQLRDWMPTLNPKSGGVVSSSDVEKPSLQVEPGDYVYIRVYKRKHWKEPRREGPFKVVLATPTAVKVEDTMRGPDQGVCQVIGSECCAVIPLNTGPLGPLSTLLDRMAAARDQMYTDVYIE
ncbi:hypothetical protein QTP86_009154 [Hemibagrus guttatus]|nr:hypothetical protein QTP86_009154 [Hemibagrus guttatus]